MSRLASLSSRRIVLLALVLAALTSILSLMSPAPAAALICNPNNGSCLEYETIYYSGPEHKKQVGECSCGNCTGEETAYYITLPQCCPCD
jgi:hypothetical protein